MNTRYTGILVIFGAILAAAVFVAFSGGKNEALRQRRYVEFFGFSEGVVSLTISTDGGKNTIQLDHMRDRWSVVNPAGTPASFRIDEPTIAPIETILRRTLVGELRSTNPSHHADYGLAKGQGVAVTPQGDGRTVLIGNTGTDRRSTFVRYANSDDVYLVPEAIPFLFTQRRTPDQWRSRVVVNVDIEAVDDLKIEQAGKDTLHFTREGKDWRVEGGPEGFRADPSLIVGLLSSLNNVRASGFADGEEVGDDVFADPVLKLSWGSEEQFEASTFVVGTAEDSTNTRYYSKGDDEDGVVLVGAFFVQKNLNGIITQLRETMPAMEAAATTSGADDATNEEPEVN